MGWGQLTRRVGALTYLAVKAHHSRMMPPAHRRSGGLFVTSRTLGVLRYSLQEYRNTHHITNVRKVTNRYPPTNECILSRCPGGPLLCKGPPGHYIH